MCNIFAELCPLHLSWRIPSTPRINFWFCRLCTFLGVCLVRSLALLLLLRPFVSNFRNGQKSKFLHQAHPGTPVVNIFSKVRGRLPPLLKTRSAEVECTSPCLRHLGCRRRDFWICSLIIVVLISSSFPPSASSLSEPILTNCPISAVSATTPTPPLRPVAKTISPTPFLFCELVTLASCVIPRAQLYLFLVNFWVIGRGGCRNRQVRSCFRSGRFSISHRKSLYVEIKS